MRIGVHIPTYIEQYSNEYLNEVRQEIQTQTIDYIIYEYYYEMEDINCKQ